MEKKIKVHKFSYELLKKQLRILKQIKYKFAKEQQDILDVKWKNNDIREVKKKDFEEIILKIEAELESYKKVKIILYETLGIKNVELHKLPDSDPELN